MKGGMRRGREAEKEIGRRKEKRKEGRQKISEGKELKKEDGREEENEIEERT